MASNATTSASSNAYTVDFLVLLGGLSAVAVVGSVGNALMLYVCARDAVLRESIGAILGVVQALALNDFLACAVGLSLYVWNMLVGGTGPFGIGVICAGYNLLVFALLRASLWYLFALAFTRFTAVMMPGKHRKLVSSKMYNVALVVLPILFGFSTKSTALALGWITIPPHPVSGRCTPSAAVETPQGFANVQMYKTADLWITFLIPGFLGLACYVTIAFKLAASKVSGAHSIVTPSAASESRPLDNAAAARARRTRKVKLLGTVYLVNMLLMTPNYVVFSVNWITKYVSSELPMLRLLVQVSIFSSLALNPIVYAAASKDYRAAYKRALTK